MGSLSLLQGIFPTQGLKPGLLHCRWIIYQLSHRRSSRKLEWEGYSFFSESSPPRNQAGASCSAGRFFTYWDIKEAHMCVCVYVCVYTHTSIHTFIYIYVVWELFTFHRSNFFPPEKLCINSVWESLFFPSLFKILWYILENILFSTEAPWLIRCPFYLICLYNPIAPFAYILLWKKKHCVYWIICLFQVGTVTF